MVTALERSPAPACTARSHQAAAMLLDPDEAGLAAEPSLRWTDRESVERLHRIFQNQNAGLKAFLDRESIAHEYEESIVGKTVFLLISERDPKWPILSEYLVLHSIPHQTELRYSRTEVQEAPWCVLSAASHFGYPQPEDEYRSVTYDAASGCEHCSIGFHQIAPFRVRRTPRDHSRARVFQLNWVFDEFFVSTVGRTAMEALGLSGARFCSPVLHKTKEPCTGWHQIQIDQVLDPVVDAKLLTPERCPSCHRTKFNFPTREPLTLLGQLPTATPDIAKLSEWFGSGGNAFRAAIVSQRFVKVMLEQRWRGIELRPLSQN